MELINVDKFCIFKYNNLVRKYLVNILHYFSVIQTQPFQSQKQDLIAELKISKDISGIKKLKVERVKMEEKQEKELVTEISRQFSVENFVEKVR